MYLAADGICPNPENNVDCDIYLEPGWHGDHVNAYTNGGPTKLTNGQPLCPSCNLKKGTRTVGIPLLDWQREALSKYEVMNPSRFLLAAFPGMGKTVTATAILRATGKFGITVVPQKDSLGSWRETLHGFGICPSSRVERDGWSRTCPTCEKPVGAAVMSYDFLQSNPHVLADMYRKHSDALLILDEVHHLADEQAWSVPFKAVRAYITSVLSLSATPFRSDEKPVPFVHTEGPWTSELSPLPESCIAEYDYGKALTMKPPPVNRAVFERYDADVTWMEDEADSEVTVKISEKNSQDISRKARRHVLNVKGNWLPTVLSQANAQLDLIRQTNGSAGGLIICKDTNSAVGIADLLTTLTRDNVHVYTQDYATNHHREGMGKLEENGKRRGGQLAYDLNDFRTSDAKWIVTVRKISEGVDVPRLQVLVYATVTRTRLFFIQAVGRVIRVVRSLHDDIDQTAWVYVPDDEYMRVFASEIEDSMIAAELNKLKDVDDFDDGQEELFGRQILDRQRAEPSDRFVSAEAEFTGTIAAGEFHDAQLAALAKEVGGGMRPAETLDLLKRLQSRGMLSFESPQPAPPTSTFSDPNAELREKTKEKNNAAGTWAAVRQRANQFASYGESISACHTELGELFNVWKSNKDVSIMQLEKATQYARERTQELTKWLRENG